MNRRILLAFLGLIGTLLGAVVFPLGLLTAGHYRSDYADATVAQAQALARVAEERLADHDHGIHLARALRRSLAPGEEVRLVGQRGSTVAAVGPPIPTPTPHFTPAGTTVSNRSFRGDGLVVATVPFGPTAHPIGSVLLARPTDPLDVKINELWLTLGGVAAATAVAAILVALLLSGWAARPLQQLEKTAQLVGAGNLDARAGSFRGPPEVRRLAATFDAMTARLQTLLEGHRAVVADVSHQLRTPISALRLRLELLAAEPKTVDTKSLTGALDELHRLSRLVDGLLAVARAESTTRNPAPVDMFAVMAERVDAWTALALERGVELVLTPGAAGKAWVVPDHLEQILDNLLGNCFDLEPAPRHVRLAAAAVGDVVEVCIADDGPGMTTQQRSRAFQRFATDRADTGGTGLGLAIVHRLVTASGGAVTLDPTAGTGLTVRLTLPRAS